MENPLRRALVLIVKAAIFLPFCSICLWWAYSMGAQVQGGFYTYREAVLLAIEMSLLTTALTATVWIVSPYIHRQATWISLAIKTVLETGFVLALYTAAVFTWRQHWTPEKGMSESAAFMPFVGHINAAFFAEFLWLEYLVAVVPFVSLLSGVLTPALDFMQRPRQLKKG
jgi:hypothetical protein